MPCDYKRYHPDWANIRRQILDQAGDCCEFCGVPNHSRLPSGGLVVLTVAHLDHDVTHNTPDNLRALCQRCHLRWDSEHHQRNAARTRAAKLSAGTVPMTL